MNDLCFHLRSFKLATGHSHIPLWGPEIWREALAMRCGTAVHFRWPLWLGWHANFWGAMVMVCIFNMIFYLYPDRIPRAGTFRVSGRCPSGTKAHVAQVGAWYNPWDKIWEHISCRFRIILYPIFYMYVVYICMCMYIYNTQINIDI